MTIYPGQWPDQAESICEKVSVYFLACINATIVSIIESRRVDSYSNTIPKSLALTPASKSDTLGQPLWHFSSRIDRTYKHPFNQSCAFSNLISELAIICQCESLTQSWSSRCHCRRRSMIIVEAIHLGRKHLGSICSVTLSDGYYKN